MVLKNNKGSALFQYAIIIGLIALTLVPVFLMFGNNIKEAFTSYSASFDANNKIIDENYKLTHPFNIKPGELGGSADNPIRKCVNETCAIDYGNLVLNGIPENFSELVQTSGGNGGTEEVLDLLSQLAQQLEENPDVPPDEVDKIKKLIDRGKQIAKAEKFFEEKIKPYKSDLQVYLNAKADLLNNFIFGDRSQANFDQGISNLNAQYQTILDNYYNDPNNQMVINVDGKDVNLNVRNVHYLLDPTSTLYFNNNELVAGGRTDERDFAMEYAFSKGLDPMTAQQQIQNNSYEMYLNGDIPIETKDLNSYMFNSYNFTNNTNFARMIPYNEATLSPVGEYLTELKTVLNSNSSIPAAQEITKVLSKEIFDIFKNVDSQSAGIFDGVDHNISTGPTFTFSDPANNMYQSPSQTTRLDLNIICSSRRGEYNPDNDACNKR